MSHVQCYWGKAEGEWWKDLEICEFHVKHCCPIYLQIPSKGRNSSISRTPTFEIWAGHQSPDYEILKTSSIGRTLAFATPTDSPAGHPAGMVYRPILTAHNKPATCGRQTSSRSMRPETQWGSYANIDNKDKCQGNNSFSFCQKMTYQHIVLWLVYSIQGLTSWPRC